MTAKTDLRARLRVHRATLARADFAEAIARFAAELALPPGAAVAGYFPVRDEADPRALMAALAARGHPLALPVVTPKRPLAFRAWRPGEALQLNAYAIPEPAPEAPRVTPAAILVPLLAFDADGHRLGYGGGYYDRTLEHLHAARAIGIAYAGQEVARLPRHAHDRPLDSLVTEAGVRRFHHR